MSEAEVLVQTGELLWDTALRVVTRDQRLYNWMKNPHPGDFVLVWMTSLGTPAEHRVGTYDTTWCYIHPDDPEWPLTAQDRAEQVFRIILLDGTMNWTNCQLLRLPRTRQERIDAVYEPCPICGNHLGHVEGCLMLMGNVRGL